MTGGSVTGERDTFAASRALFGSTLEWLDGGEVGVLDHAQLETQLQGKGRELRRQLYQDSMDLRAARERPPAQVVDADGLGRTRVESGHTRALTTVFGEVSVSRKAYRAPGEANLHPADGQLNLPAVKHSHGLRRLAAIEAARGSFDDTVAAIDRNTGVRWVNAKSRGLLRRQQPISTTSTPSAHHHHLAPVRTPNTPRCWCVPSMVRAL